MALCTLAMPWLRWLPAGLSLGRSRFMPGSDHVGFVVDKVALNRFFSKFFIFALSV
jgi:hypothetical protein